MHQVLRGARKVAKERMGTVNECGMVLGYDLGLEMRVEHGAVFLVPGAVGQARKKPRETHPVVEQHK